VAIPTERRAAIAENVDVNKSKGGVRIIESVIRFISGNIDAVMLFI
jgi:hypothetical protein